MNNVALMLQDPTCADRFWAKVDRREQGDCWPWLGRSTRGRGTFTANGVTTTAPRVALMLAIGEMPHDKPFACHACDNPACCNPEHLWWGSNQDNLKDAAAKGRLPLQKVTSCKYGHEFTPANTRINSRGQRQCRECQKTWRNKSKRLRKLRLAAGKDASCKTK